jgi:CDP-diacylglycerol--glycerol-3-phosphate 3-phosphatidyltransferase
MASPLTTTRPAPPRFWNVPNTLTVGRLVLGLVVCALISAHLYFVALAIFAVAAITDALDGYLARLLKQETAIGRQLDPLVDKLIVAGALIFLLPLPVKATGLLPWMVTTIVIRELIVQALRSLIEGRGEPFGAKMAGKLKTTFQCLAIGTILFVLGLVEPASVWTWLRDAFLWIAIALTIYSGYSYLVLAWPKLKGERSS